MEDDYFIPAKLQNNWVLYGSLNHYYPLVWLIYTIYERLKLADKLITSLVEEKFKNQPDLIRKRAMKFH